MFYRAFTLLVCAAALGACHRAMPYVSAHNNSQSYVTERQNIPTEAAYVSAFEAAQKEFAHEVNASENGVSDIVYGKAGDADFTPRKEQTAFDAVWGRPPGTVDEGLTLRDSAIRKRLNDALETTPMQGEARWTNGSKRYVFRPNSELYQPFYSGGRCRDGIFVMYDSYQEFKTRGLFCQQGPGAGWMLLQ